MPLSRTPPTDKQTTVPSNHLAQNSLDSIDDSLREHGATVGDTSLDSLATDTERASHFSNTQLCNESAPFPLLHTLQNPVSITQRRRTVYQHAREDFSAPNSYHRMSQPVQTGKGLSTIQSLTLKHDNVVKFIGSLEKLELDGSNLSQWKLRTARAVYNMTGVTDYWTCDKTDPDSPVKMLIDKCAGRVIEETIHEDLKDTITNTVYAHDAMDIITEQFRPGGRTSQFSIFRSLIYCTFDPSTTELMTHVQGIHRDLDRLESEGFKWTRDYIQGMMYQLGAPLSGDFGMDTVNSNLDARFRSDLSPFTSAEVRAVMQLVITNRKTAIESETQVRALATSFNRTMTPARWGARTMVPTQSHGTTLAGGPVPISGTTAARDSSVTSPIPVPRGAVESVQQGLEQCFYCGKFNHRSDNCQAKQRNRTRTALHWNNSRRTTNGRMYSVDVLWPNAERIKAVQGAVVSFGGTGGDRVNQVSAAAVSWSAEGMTADAVPTEYLLDGGATHHVSHRLDRFDAYTPLSSPMKLNTAAHGDHAFIVGKGRLSVPATDGTLVWLEDVFYSPQATDTFISQASLVEAGGKMWFWGNDVVICMPSGQKVVATYRDRQWKIDANNIRALSSEVPEKHGRVTSLEVAENKTLARLCHGHFGHVDSKRIRKLFARQMGLGAPTSLHTSSFVCEDCLICKSTRNRKLGRSGRELGLLDVILSDVMGPAPPPRRM